MKTDLNLSKLYLFISFMLISSLGWGQGVDHVQGEMLVQCKAEHIETIVKETIRFQGNSTNLKMKEVISPLVNIYLFTFDAKAVNEVRLLEYFKSHPLVNEAQFNHLVSLRNEPNDTDFPQQWHFLNTGQFGGTDDADIDATEAWDITTGGQTVVGDEIVVAVLDDGIDIAHPDIVDNLWVNNNEIPGNGIDDDDNGYIDDFQGWNIFTEDDNIGNGFFDGFHGTQVCGMIGAIGNNDLGVTGVNWNVKMMIVKNDFNTQESEVLKAYDYPLVMRKLYNETDGAKGAFVVATNASWGVDFGDPDDVPLWCAFYDTLGHYGVLNIGATSNLNYDVDQQGDLPSSCSSEYLIPVTATDFNDQRNFSAFGANTIDLAAPGDNVYTTQVFGGYGSTSGTSFAAPLVAGAVALLYSVPCNDFVDLSKSNPSAAAMLAKNFILNGVDLIPNLADEVSSGGRLNVNNSILAALNECGACIEPDFLAVNEISDVEATLTWFSPGANSFTLEWRPLGAGLWNAVSDAPNPLVLEGLTACTDYEFRVLAACTDSTTEFSDAFVFKTDGCCLPPFDISFVNISNTSALVNWNPILAALGYNVRIREVGTTNWEELSANQNFLNFSDLSDCTDYEFQIQTVCDGSLSDFSTSFFFTTGGCGACFEGDYCEPDASSIFSDLEWIESVELGSIDNVSGNDGGYAVFQNNIPDVTIDSGYTISVTPGFSGFEYLENFQAWIDFNHDGDFDDPNEKIMEEQQFNTTVSSSFVVPSDAIWGATKMRVILSFGFLPDPCGIFFSGEVEDYCVNILPPFFPCLTPTNLDTLAVNTNGATIGWEGESVEGIGFVVRYRESGTNDWTEVVSTDNKEVLTDLEFCRKYEVQIKTLCLSDQSVFSDIMEFSTACAVSSFNLANSTSVHEASVFPNPFTNRLQVQLNAGENVNGQIELYNSLGKQFRQVPFSASSGIHLQELNGFEALPAGVYWLKVKTEDGWATTRQLVKME